ncbi:MAG TPA: AAA family ATPase [Candidatus Scatomorpha gallistercoris]|nr:AAA family ATPase [Candidatus Scatomorpha gallistercoris]
MQDPAYLPTVTMTELYDTVYESKPPVIDGLFQNGTYIFAGAPKVGKSFLMAQLAYHVATGKPLWGYEVHQGTVLYLALEDDYGRLQGRMSRMFGVGAEGSVFFSVQAKLLSDGLDGQLEYFVREHPDTRLIIIDTLQKVREASRDYSYSSDYELVTRLKSFADKHKLCVQAVHHTRKQAAGDCFEMLSGTNGLLGCADGALLMRKEKRTDLTATLDVVGRDQPDQRLHIVKERDSLVWNLESAETELWKKPPDAVLDSVRRLVEERGGHWEGSPSELALALGSDMAVNRLTRHLNVNAGRLLNEYSARGTAHHADRRCYSRGIGKRDACDGCNDSLSTANLTVATVATVAEDKISARRTRRRKTSRPRGREVLSFQGLGCNSNKAFFECVYTHSLPRGSIRV